MDWIIFEVAFLYFCNWFTLGPFSLAMFDKRFFCKSGKLAGKLQIFACSNSYIDATLFSLLTQLRIRRIFSPSSCFLYFLSFFVKRFVKIIFWESMCWRPHFLWKIHAIIHDTKIKMCENNAPSKGISTHCAGWTCDKTLLRLLIWFNARGL